MARRRKKRGGLLVVSGFSGVGKGTVIKKLMSEHPEYAFSVSATTRAPRPGEVDGKDYFFVAPETFDQWVEEERFLEYARFFNRSYGTLKDHVEELRNAGNTVILDIEVEGAMNVCRLCPDAVTVYIIPPDAKELVRRITGRGTETEEQITNRMIKAVREADIVDQYGYVVVNDDVDATAAEIHALAQGKGGARVPREEALKLTKAVQAELTEILKDRGNHDIIPV
ncbi:MAG: guanylate kinase [Lachnospiraceae bacterium]|nr:guanylate kinase [Lachnospiraceae bacterium]